MSINKKKLIIIAVIAVLGLSLSQLVPLKTAQADSKLWNDARNNGLDAIGSQAYEGAGSNPSDIRVIIARLVKVFLGFMGIVFIALIVWAGYKYMTAQGDSSQVEAAVGQIRTGVIGLVIIVAAYAITTFVADKIVYVVTKY